MAVSKECIAITDLTEFLNIKVSNLVFGIPIDKQYNTLF